MALIKCPECGTEVSDKAGNCIKCAYPLNDGTRTAINKNENVTTIQKTSKKFKGHILIALGAFFIGIMILGSSKYSMLGGLLITFSIIWIIATKIRIWWHHS